MSDSAPRSSPPMYSCDWLRALPSAARFILQGRSEARRAAAAPLGLQLPEEACRAAANTQRAALWLGPDEQLLIGWQDDAAMLAAALEAALAGLPHSLVDISHRQVALQLRGVWAADILGTGCPLDLDLSAFPVDMCTRTVFAKAEIVLWRRDTEEFHLEVGRSFADYVSRWMREAAQDFLHR